MNHILTSMKVRASLHSPPSSTTSSPSLLHLTASILLLSSSMKSNGIKRHAAYCCGPKQLVEQTWEGTSALSDDNIQFAFHHETFEF